MQRFPTIVVARNIYSVVSTLGGLEKEKQFQTT